MKLKGKKAIVLVESMYQELEVWYPLLRLREEGAEVVITALPLYHVFALTANCLVYLMIGGTSVLITNPRDAEAFPHAGTFNNNVVTMAAGIAALTALVQRSVHLGAILTLAFLLKPPFAAARKDRFTVCVVMYWFLVLASVSCVRYICVNLTEIFEC